MSNIILKAQISTAICRPRTMSISRGWTPLSPGDGFLQHSEHESFEFEKGREEASLIDLYNTMGSLMHEICENTAIQVYSFATPQENTARRQGSSLNFAMWTRATGIRLLYPAGF